MAATSPAPLSLDSHYQYDQPITMSQTFTVYPLTKSMAKHSLTP
jgi:hypothetical protein